MRKWTALSSAGVTILVTFLLAHAAIAADTIAADNTSLEAIVVTAERHNSTVLNTPISITAISGAQLVAQGLSSLEDVAAQTPGISMKQFSPGQTEYEMRGLPSSGGSSATVGLYVNDVPMAASAGSFNGKAMIDPDLFDLARVEVLRGPQGTLYGAGSMGGTIRLITAPPEFNKVQVASQSIVSETAHGGLNWGQSGMVNLPLIDDKLALRLVGTDKYNDGWINDIVVNPFPIGPTGACGWPTCTRGDVQAAPVVSNTRNSNWERLAGGRAALRYQPTDDLRIDLLGMYQGLSLGGFPQADASVGIDALSHYQPVDVPTRFKDTFKVFSLSINYDLGFAKLTSDSANWVHESAWTADATESTQYLFNYFYGFSTFVPIPYYNSDHTQQLSEELRLTSEGDGKAQWTVGAFYSDFKSVLRQFNGNAAFASLSTGGVAANPTGIIYIDNSPYHIKQYALFAEGSYRITDTVKATIGVRGFKYRSLLNYDESGIYSSSGNATAVTGIVEGTASGVSPKVNISYKPTQDVTLYAQIAKGFRPGGVNLPDAVPPCATPVPTSYGPDSIWDYEMGEKAQFANRRIFVNADVFYIRWNAVQENLTLPCSYPFTTNVGTAESYGPEIEINSQVSRNITLTLNGAYTQAHITSVNPSLRGNTIGSVQPLLPGTPVLNVPKYDFTAAINFSHPITDKYRVTARLSSTTTGPFYDINYAVAEVPGNTIADARIGVIGGPWAVYLFAQNLTNKISILTTNTHSWSEPTPALDTPSVTTPRTIGLEVNYKY